MQDHRSTVERCCTVGSSSGRACRRCSTTRAAGRSGALVVRGPAGIGKSALLDELAVADGFLVLRGQGLESEFPLAFAGVHQLLRPLLRLLDTLPDPQAHALRVAFGSEQGPSVDPFLVALATLALLTEAAESQPVLCLVDDVHWLDAASADALLFAARRLHADRVALVLTVRDGDARSFVADDLPELRAGRAARAGGPRGAGRAAARGRADGGVGRAARAERRQPARAARAAQGPERRPAATGARALPAQLPLTDRVQRAFLDRCRRLPEQVQTLLLVAAADDSRQVAVVRRAARALGVDESAFAQAEHAGLLVSDGDTLAVRHPLVRSAVYQTATGQERRTAHARARRRARRRRRRRPAGVAPGRRGRGSRPGRGGGPGASRPAAPSTVAATLPRPPRTSGRPSSPPAPRPAPRCSSPPPATPGPTGRACGPPPCSRTPGQAATTGWCAPTSTGSAAASRSTSAPPPPPTGSSSQQPWRSPRTTRPGPSEMAAAASVHEDLRRRQRPGPAGRDRRPAPRPPPTRRGPSRSSSC